MYEAGGRETDYRDAEQGFNSKRQPYGSQLGWHGLNVVTGQLLLSKPVAIGPNDTEDPWPEWIGRRTLTRPDGLWLSDGIDPAPIETHINLFGSNARENVTTDERKILSLLLIDNDQSKEIVLSGGWSSPDGIHVSISSCFVIPDKAKEVALEIAKADGFNAWLPVAHDYGSPGDGERAQRKRTFPFLSYPSTEAGIDEYDPLGSIVTMCRPQFSEDINSKMGLKTVDPFKRQWTKGKKRIVCRSEAWGSSARGRDGETDTGKRFCCTKEFISELLKAHKMDMLLLVLLRKYDRGYSGKASEYWHTSAVIHLKSDMTKVYYAGLASAKHESKY